MECPPGWHDAVWADFCVLEKIPNFAQNFRTIVIATQRHRTTAFALLMLFLSFAAGRTMFYHSHIGSHGAIIVHSHLFGSTQHSHDSSAIESIDFLMAADLSDATASQEIPDFHSSVEAVSVQPCSGKPVVASCRDLSLRAPPVKG